MNSKTNALAITYVGLGQLTGLLPNPRIMYVNDLVLRLRCIGKFLLNVFFPKRLQNFDYLLGMSSNNSNMKKITRQNLKFVIIFVICKQITVLIIKKEVILNFVR